MSQTPIQFVYPDIFKCFQKMGCCKSKKINVDEFKKIPEFSHTYINEMLLDKYLEDKGLKIECDETHQENLQSVTLQVYSD